MFESPSSEIWICEAEGRVVGTVTVITDIERHNAEFSGPRSSVGRRLYVRLRHPRLMAAKILGRLAALTNHTHVCPDASEVMSRCRKPVWLNMVGVLPQTQGLGVGQAVAAFCEERARSLGYDSAKLIVDKCNPSALRFWRRAGYKVTSLDKHQYILAKPFRHDSDAVGGRPATDSASASEA